MYNIEEEKMLPANYPSNITVLLWVLIISNILLWVLAITLSLLFLTTYDSGEIEFAVKHFNDITGEQVTEVISYSEEAGLDNSSSTKPLQVQIQFERNYRHQIIDRITDNQVSSQRVQEKIAELYKLPPNDPEGTLKTAICPVSVVIPAGQKTTVIVEWTESWAEGIINEGKEGAGNRLGNYSVFLGYIEPCSLVNQVNE